MILISGCGLKQEKQLYSKDEAERKFIQISKDEYNWDVSTKLIGNTFWIYLPYEEEILKFKANKFTQAPKFSVTFLNGDFKEGEFDFEYQIVPLVKTEENKGFTYSLTDEKSKDFHYLLNVINRVYFNAQEQPEFYVIVLADIVNGMEIIYIIYGLDLKKAYNNAIAIEEYYKRILQDMKGSLAIINDKTGRHLTYEEKNLEQFLVEQIVRRIRVKFSGEKFKLQGTTEEEILKIISYCLKTYGFTDFWSVTLEDLLTGSKTTKSRSGLAEFKEF